MAKSKKSSTQARKKRQHEQATQPDKRNTLKLLRNGALGLGAVALAGVFGTRAVRATIQESDLSRIGNGKPSIVQVHDPDCALCTRLQKEARQAVKQLDDPDLQFLVANIMSTEGAAFSRRYGVPHVTLVLFDGKGDVQGVLQGVRQDDELLPEFQALVAR